MKNTSTKKNIKDGREIIISVDDRQELIKAIKEYYYNRNKLELDGKFAANYVQRYTWENYSKNISALIDSLLFLKN